MKKIWIVIAAIAVVVGAAIAYVVTRDGDMPYEQNTQQEQTSDTGEQTQQTNNTPDSKKQTAAESNQPGKYTDYSAQTVANTSGRKWIFFHAPWCPQCRALEADIQQQGVPNGLTIFKADYDSSVELKQKYGVTLQTTIVEINDQGEETDQFVAYDDPTLEAVLDALGR